MAEFCLKCLNKYLLDKKQHLTKKDVTMSIDLCEGCGKWKPCVITIVKKEKVFGGKGKRKKNRTVYK